MSPSNFVRVSFVFLLFIQFGCGKDANTDNDSIDKEIVVIGGISYEVVSSISIEQISDSANWLTSTGGVLRVDTSITNTDSLALYLAATDGCFSAEQIQGTPQILKQECAIQFQYQLPITTFNDIRDGNGFTCAGACRMEIFQGEELLLSEWVRERDVWGNAEYFFRTKITDEVKIRFVVGSKKGFWIDDIKLLQKL
jgi:hypothetical protein